MEKKFKNADFRVAGNQFLLKAFLEEAKSRYGIPTYTDKTHEKNDVILEDSTFKGGATRPEKYRLYTLPQHYQQAMDEIAELEIKELPTFKEGEWYTHNDGSVARYQGEKQGYGWDTWSFADKMESHKVPMDAIVLQTGQWRKATDKEIEEALVKIAAERGFKKGVRYRDISRKGVLADYSTTADYEPKVYAKAKGDDGEPALICGYANGFIYINKHWAEVVTVTPDVTVGGKKGKFADDGVTFGCTWLSKDRIRRLYGFLREWNDGNATTNTVIETLESVTGVKLHISTLKIMYEYYFGKNESTGN